jgi:hypothetical protein
MRPVRWLATLAPGDPRRTWSGVAGLGWLLETTRRRPIALVPKPLAAGELTVLIVTTHLRSKTTANSASTLATHRANPTCVREKTCSIGP